MRNTQKPEPPVDIRNTGKTLEVHSKWTTIQGEGPFAGTPATFIRLAGCNLQCPLCDTEYTSKRERVDIFDLTKWIKEQPYNLVVLTGGEPFRQNLRPFAVELEESGFILQIETNGTVFPENFPIGSATIVCSPKSSLIAPRMAEGASAWKYVCRHDAMDSTDGLPTSALGMRQKPSRPLNKRPVYLQPCDDKDPEINKLNLESTVKSCMTFGYRLNLQIQKIIGMP